MTSSGTAPWRPTAFRRFAEAIESSTGVARIMTDAGEAFIKALGNREGPHALAREWIGTSLAEWFGLSTFEFAILTVTPDDEIPLGHKCFAKPGPAFATKAVRGFAWGGDERHLKRLENPGDITRLVVFDTWVLNVDRHPPRELKRKPNYDNVFLTAEGARPGHLRLIAMDFSHCLLGEQDLDRNIAGIQHVKDDRIYGLFPEFGTLLDDEVLSDALARLKALDKTTVASVVERIPEAWEVPRERRESIGEFLLSRSRYLAENLRRALGTYIAVQDQFGFQED